MNGEYIRRAREDLQFLRGQMMGGLGFGGNSFSSNPGVLANFQLGKRIQERVQTMRRPTNLPPAAKTKKEEEKAVINEQEEEEEIRERFRGV